MKIWPEAQTVKVLVVESGGLGSSPGTWVRGEGGNPLQFVYFLFFEEGPLPDLGTHQFGWSGQPASPIGPFDSAFPALVTEHTTEPSF